jgi:nicotinic acetylcholine receptor
MFSPREITYMTSRLRTKDEENELISDWKFAAMVIDR